MVGTHFVNMFVSLFVITNPIGNLPIFIGLTQDYDKARRRHAAFVVLIASFIIMMLSEWAGQHILHFFGISIHAFTLAGGFVIFMIGYHMLSAKTSSLQHSAEENQIAKNKEGSIAVVPMSIPLIAGPGTMSTIILTAHATHKTTGKLIDSAVILIIVIIIFIALLLSSSISRLLGAGGVKIVTRIMGLILMAIAVGMMALRFNAPGYMQVNTNIRRV